MRDLTVTVIQTNLIWEDPGSNLAMFSEKISSFKEAPDLVVLPEMFTTGFTMNPAGFAEKMEGPTVDWMLQTASEGKFHLIGSIAIREEGQYYNRLVWAFPDGDLLTYDKRHLFRMAGEEKVYTPGNSHVTARAYGWMVRPFICYDLRFPLWCRNHGNEYDIALFVANWPERRASHWKTLLEARAIENQSYVIGCNRTGFDGNGIAYSGDSCIIDPLGRIIIRETEAEGIITAHLSCAELASYREKFPVWKDADGNTE